jgi:hypothetical protein
VTLSTTMLDARPEAAVHMAHESIWPFMLTVSLTVLFYGFLIEAVPLAALGLAASFGSVLAWFWPRGETQET